jgi:transcriptional regulator
LIETFEGLVECLKELTAHSERHWPSGWKFWVPDDLGEKFLPKAIVGFKISVDDVSFKKKLSQNRPPEEVKGVLNGLRARGDACSLALLQEMLGLYDAEGRRK